MDQQPNWRDCGEELGKKGGRWQPRRLLALVRRRRARPTLKDCRARRESLTTLEMEPSEESTLVASKRVMYGEPETGSRGPDPIRT